MDVLDRFESKYIPEALTGCFLWTGAGDRYGKIKVGGKTVGAHVLAYTLFKGPVPEGAHVCHHCDNTFCVNPDHLFLGDAESNARDRDRKLRHYNSRPDIGDEVVAQLVLSQEKVSALADKHGVSASFIYHLRAGERRRSTLASIVPDSEVFL